MKSRRELFEDWLAADDAFQQALVRQFGDDACNARYRPCEFGAEVVNAERRFHEAAAAYCDDLGYHSVAEAHRTRAAR